MTTSPACSRPWPFDHDDVETCPLAANHAGSCVWWTARRRDRGEAFGIDWQLIAFDRESRIVLDLVVADPPAASRVRGALEFVEAAARSSS